MVPIPRPVMEFEPLQLDLVRRNSLEDLSKVPLPSDNYTDKKEAAFRANMIIRGVISDSSNHESEGDEDVSSEDEVYARLFPSSAIATDMRITRSKKGKKGVQKSGKKRSGKSGNTPSSH